MIQWGKANGQGKGNEACCSQGALGPEEAEMMAHLASTLQVTAPVPILAFLTLQPAGVGRADARARLGVAGVVCVSAVTG